MHPFSSYFFQLIKINNSFKGFYLPKNIYPLNVKLLPIQQLNKNDFDIYVSFDKNELIMKRDRRMLLYGLNRLMITIFYFELRILKNSNIFINNSLE